MKARFATSATWYTVILAGSLMDLAGHSLAATIRPSAFDSRAIASAIEHAQPGDTVLLPEGTFALTEAVELRSGIKFLGAGQDKTRLTYRGTEPAVLVDLSDCEDVEVSHLTLDGLGNPLVEQGIRGSNSRRLWLHHLTIRNLVKSDTFGPHAIYFTGHKPTGEEGVTDSRITDCRIENIGLGANFGGGIRLNWGCVRNQIVGNVIHSTGRGGIFGDHSAELVIRNNRVSGSGGVGLGIEIWGGCPRSLIEDNIVDHWISNDGGDQSAVRRNTIATDDGTLKGYGIEIIARDVVVTDNRIGRGAAIGLSVSNKPVKNNVYWGYNTVRDCIQWGAQLQGESGGIAHHYFYRCTFEKTAQGDSRARYPNDSGHGFRTNGSCHELVFEDCVFSNNGGYGVQLGGKDVDKLFFLRSAITTNGSDAVDGPRRYTALEFDGCRVQGNGSDTLPAARPFPIPSPVALFAAPNTIRAGEPARFRCTSRAGAGPIVERLWDFGHGIPETTSEPSHSFDEPGNYRLTLIVWDAAGRGGRAEQTIQVLPRRPPLEVGAR